MNEFTMRSLSRLLSVIVLSAFAMASCNTGVKEVTVRVRSMLYPAFKEDHTVGMYEKFSISDTDLEGVVVDFIPDFAIDTVSNKVISRSDTLNNPAAKVLVIQGRDKREEIWAFPPGVMPHFSPTSFIGFELLDYKVGGRYKKPKSKGPGGRMGKED